MKINLTLSGGAARISYLAGVLEAFDESDEIEICQINGTSAGALAGAAYVCGKAKRLKFLVRSAVPYLIKRLGGGGMTKLLLRTNVKLSKVKIPLNINFFSLRDYEHIIVSNSDFTSDKEFRKAIRASATIPFPLFFKRVKHISTKSNDYFDCVDGGVEERALNIRRDDMVNIVIDTSSDKHPPYEAGGRVNDLFTMINYMLKSDKYKADYYIMPKAEDEAADLLGGVYNFGRKSMRKSYDYGYKQGKEFVNKIENGSII